MPLRRDWREDARCAGLPADEFFGVGDMMSKIEVGLARRVCSQCPVRAECLADALSRRERYGIWGGLSYSERERALSALGSVQAVLAHYVSGDLEALVVQL